MYARFRFISQTAADNRAHFSNEITKNIGFCENILRSQKEHLRMFVLTFNIIDNICCARYKILCFICDPCNERGGGPKKENLFCQGGLDILWNNTMNINDAHIFLIGMLESQSQKIQS